MKKRCFIAINLSENVKEQLDKLISQLKKINCAPVINYVKSKGVHLTLHFLGYLDEQQINQIQDILKNLTSQYSATKLLTQTIGAFPNLERPRVVFLASEEKNQGNIVGLQQKLGEEIEKMGIEVDHRPWQPHLTLARIKGPCQFETDYLKIPQLEIPVETIELMESNLSPHGAEYKIIESYSLKD